MPFPLRNPRVWLIVVAAVLAVVIVVVINRDEDDAPPGQARELTGYWQNYADENAKNLRLRDVPEEYSTVIVAFAVADPARKGAIRFAVDPSLSEALGGYTDADLIADVRALHQQERSVLLSVGGASDDVQVRDEAAAVRFAESADALLERFGFDGLDIDLEHGIDPPSLAAGLRGLAARVGPELVLTLAPQTVDLKPSGAYLKLIKDIKDIITAVHTQYYNSGSMEGCDGKVYEAGSVDFVTAQACTLLRVLAPEQVSLGFPATRKAATSGYVSSAIVNAAVDCLTRRENCGDYTPDKAVPDLRGVMTWSINADAAADYAFARAVTDGS